MSIAELRTNVYYRVAVHVRTLLIYCTAILSSSRASLAYLLVRLRSVLRPWSQQSIVFALLEYIELIILGRQKMYWYPSSVAAYVSTSRCDMAGICLYICLFVAQHCLVSKDRTCHS